MDFIVRETCSEIKTLARKILAENWVKITIAMALYYFLITKIPAAVDELLPSPKPGADFAMIMGEKVDVVFLSGICRFLMRGIFKVGLFSFMLCFVRKKNINAVYLLHGFKNIGKNFYLTIQMGGYIVLWTILGIFPGIVAVMNYSQSYIVMADHPEYSSAECIRESKRYMLDNKRKWLCLIFSFIGWVVPVYFMIYYVPTVLPAINEEFIAFMVRIPYFFFLAYFYTSMIVFYELISQNLTLDRRTMMWDDEFFHR